MSAPVQSKPLQVQAAAPVPSVMSMAQNSNNVPFLNTFGTNAAAGAQQAPTAYSPPKPQFNPVNQAYPHSIPATQCLPATTQPIQPAAVPPVQSLTEDRPHSNGTAVVGQKDNHVTNNTNSSEKSATEEVDKMLVPEPAAVPQVSEATETNPVTSTLSIANATSPVMTPEKCKADEKIPKDLHTENDTKENEAREVKERKSPVKVNALSTYDLKVEKSQLLPKTEHKTKDIDTKDLKTGRDSPESKETSKVKVKTDDKEKAEDKVLSNKTEDTPDDGAKDKVQTEEAQSTTVSSAPSTPQKPKEQSTPVKSPMKLATTPRTPQRRSRTPKGEDSSPRNVTPKASTTTEPKPSTSKSPAGGKTKRSRVRTQPYQSPLPELEIITKISTTTTPKTNENKLIVFFKNEFLAVRNSDGGFFVCQAVQNVYKRTSRIKIRWLSQDKSEKSNEIYTPDFYDNIDFECILTNLELSKVDKHKFRLPAKEHKRTENILKRAIAVEKGDAIALDDSMTEDNPDGLDVSLYTEEEQLTKRKGVKRKRGKNAEKKEAGDDDDDDNEEGEEPPVKSTKKAGRKPGTPAPEPRKNTAVGRAERAKRRSNNEETKTSPVIDNKKAKVLAKVVKRTAAASPKNMPKTKAKVTKPAAVPSTSKAKTLKASPLPERKTPKRGRK